MEKNIREALVWLDESEARKLTLALTTMRYNEADYRLSYSDVSKALFFVNHDLFNQIFGSIDGSPAMKGQVEAQFTLYANSFRQWIDVCEPGLSLPQTDGSQQQGHDPARGCDHPGGHSDRGKGR